MSLQLYQEPQLENPVMLCGWPGIGNVGLTAIDSLRTALGAKLFGHIEPYQFFYPAKVVIHKGLLENLEFPASRFYFKQLEGRDLIFFIGEQQPRQENHLYAEGKKAYQMAQLVLDVAQKFNCQRLYTSGAAVTQIHHTSKSMVWAVPNDPGLIDEIYQYENAVLMSQLQQKTGQGFITGLNGLLLGVAKKRGLQGLCLMGEVPYYLQGAPWPYPKASESVIEVLSEMLNIQVDLTQLRQLAKKVENTIDNFLNNLYQAPAVPPEVKQQIEGLRHARQARMGPITEREQKKIIEHIDELFKGQNGHDKRRQV